MSFVPDHGTSRLKVENVEEDQGIENSSGPEQKVVINDRKDSAFVLNFGLV